MDNIILKTNRTEMKFPLEFIKAEDIVEAIGDEETTKFMDSAPKNYTLKDAEKFMGFLRATRKSEKYLQLGVFDDKTGQFIGMCTLEAINIENHTCDLGYWLSKKFTGKGYMTECATALIQFAKEKLNLKTIAAFVITEHVKSINLLERLGFERKELLVNNTVNNGHLVNRYLYELNCE